MIIPLSEAQIGMKRDVGPNVSASAGKIRESSWAER